MIRRHAVSCSILTLLLIAIGAPPAAAQSALGSWLRSGSIALDLVDLAPSAVNLDFDALNVAACRNGTGETLLPKQGGGSEECRLVAGNGGNGGLLPDGDIYSDLRLRALRFSYDPSGCGLWADVVPVELELRGREPLALDCGSFSFRVTLQPGQPQQISRLRLYEAESGASAGWFHGTLAIAARVDLSGGELTAPASVPLQLALDLAGPWTAIDTGSTSALPPAASTLVLLAREEGGEWAGKTSCGQDRAACSRLCLAAPKSRLDWLNGSGGTPW